MSRLTLGGSMFLYNGVERDYCFEQALEGLVAVCDEVAVIDCHSTDGTLDVLQQWWDKHDKIKLEQRNWKPSPEGQWLQDLANEARQMLTTDMHLMLGADEVLHPEQYGRLADYVQQGRVVEFRRYNFRGSARHITPMDRGGGGDWFRRLGPTHLPAVVDGADLADTPDRISGMHSKLALYHYGQVRRPEGFIRKSQDMMAGYYPHLSTDPILEAVRVQGMQALCDASQPTAVPWSEMVPFEGTHPPSMVPWLRERGYEV